MIFPLSVRYLKSPKRYCLIMGGLTLGTVLDLKSARASDGMVNPHPG